MLFFSRPKFRIQRVKYVAYQTKASLLTLEQQRSETAWRLSPVKCAVCVFRARLSALEVSMLSLLSFLVQMRDMFRLRSPSMKNAEVYRLWELILHSIELF